MKPPLQVSDDLQESENPKYIYTPTAWGFIEDWESELCILGGPMNLGKGAASAMKLFQYIFYRAPVLKGYRTSTFFGIRHSYDAFKESTLEEIYKWFPPGCVFPPKRKISSHTTEVKIQVPKTKDAPGIDAKIILISMNNFNMSDVLSYNITGLQWSELQENEEEQLLTNMMDRTGRYPYRDMPQMAFGDINYTDDTHWIYDRFINKKDHTENVLKWKMHRIPSVIDLNDEGVYVENPEAELPSHKRNYKYWWNIVNRGNEGEIRIKVIGDFALMAKGTPVYPTFKDHMIVKKKPMQGRTLLFGIDPGNKHHLAIVFGQLDAMGKLIILGAMSPAHHMDLRSFLEDMFMPFIMTEIYPEMCPEGGDCKIKTFGWRDPTDPEDRQSNKDTGDIIREMTGVNTEKCSTNAVNLRTDAVTSRIRRDLLEIDERAGVLIKAMKGGYHIDKKGLPDKGRYSHVGNALEYLCYGIDNHMGAFGMDDDLENLPSLFT